MVRSFVNLLIRFFRPPQPTQLFGDFEEALAFLEKHFPVPAPAPLPKSAMPKGMKPDGSATASSGCNGAMPMEITLSADQVHVHSNGWAKLRAAAPIVVTVVSVCDD